MSSIVDQYCKVPSSFIFLLFHSHFPKGNQQKVFCSHIFICCFCSKVALILNWCLLVCSERHCHHDSFFSISFPIALFPACWHRAKEKYPKRSRYKLEMETASDCWEAARKTNSERKFQFLNCQVIPVRKIKTHQKVAKQFDNFKTQVLSLPMTREFCWPEVIEILAIPQCSSFYILFLYELPLLWL